MGLDASRRISAGGVQRSRRCPGQRVPPTVPPAPDLSLRSGPNVIHSSLAAMESWRQPPLLLFFENERGQNRLKFYRFAVLEAFQRMYGLQIDGDLNYLPHMPNDGDTWSVMQSWVLPTRSFLEFVMFSRH